MDGCVQAGGQEVACADGMTVGMKRVCCVSVASVEYLLQSLVLGRGSVPLADKIEKLTKSQVFLLCRLSITHIHRRLIFVVTHCCVKLVPSTSILFQKSMLEKSVCVLTVAYLALLYFHYAFLCRVLRILLLRFTVVSVFSCCQNFVHKNSLPLPLAPLVSRNRAHYLYFWLTSARVRMPVRCCSSYLHLDM